MIDSLLSSEEEYEDPPLVVCMNAKIFGQPDISYVKECKNSPGRMSDVYSEFP